MTIPVPSLQKVRMVGRQIVVTMFDHLRIVGRPHGQTDADCDYSQPSQDDRRSRQPEDGAGPAGERIGDQPACVRQRELRGNSAGRSSGLAERRSKRPEGVCAVE